MKVIAIFLMVALTSSNVSWADVNNGGASNRQEQYNNDAYKDWQKKKDELEQQKIDSYNASKDENGCYAGLAGAECRKAFRAEKNQRAELMDNAELTRNTGKRQMESGEGQKKMGMLTVILGVAAAVVLPGQGSAMMGIMMILQGMQMMQSGEQMIKQGKDTYDSAKKFENQAAFESALEADALNEDPAQYCLPSQGSYKEPWCQIAAAQGLLENSAALKSYSGSNGQPALAVPKYKGGGSSGPSTNASNVAMTTAASRFSDAVGKVPGIREAFSKGYTGEAMARAVAGDNGVAAYHQLQSMTPEQKMAMIGQAASLGSAVFGTSLSASDWGQYIGGASAKPAAEGDGDAGFKMMEQASSPSDFKAMAIKDDSKKNPLDIFGKKPETAKAFKQIPLDESKRKVLQMADAADNLFYLVEVRYTIKGEEFREMSMMMLKEEAARKAELLKEKKLKLANSKNEGKSAGKSGSSISESSEVKM